MGWSRLGQAALPQRQIPPTAIAIHESARSSRIDKRSLLDPLFFGQGSRQVCLPCQR